MELRFRDKLSSVVPDRLRTPELKFTKSPTSEGAAKVHNGAVKDDQHRSAAGNRLEVRR
jgi:hypothetical protein